MDQPHHHHQFHHHQQQQLQIPPSSFSSLRHQSHETGTTTTTTTSTAGGGGDRFPQWSIQETKEFLTIRAELDQTFMETKRNKQLWEVISNSMKEKGFQRSAEQCKCKWKNLVTRYKGCETMEQEALRQQFPFYNELQAIFTSRMQRMLWAEAEGTSKNKNKAMHHHHHHLSSEDEEENIIGNELESEDQHQQKGITRKKKKAKIIGGNSSASGNNNDDDNNNNKMLNNLKKILEEFMRQQMQIEAQWVEAYETRENERRMKEIEWRQAMEALENERIIMDQRWREREEQRRIREEARAEKRDALITALLNKLEREEI